MSDKNLEIRGARPGSVLAVVRHPAVRTTLLIAGGGVALVLANGIYAKLMAPAEFGRLVLLQTVAFVAMGVLPLGFDGLMLRKEVAAPMRAIGWILSIEVFVCVVLVAVGRFAFEIDIGLLLVVLVASVAGGATRLFAAIEQAKLQFLRAQLISQAALILFLVAATTQALLGTASWQGAGAIYAVNYALAAALGWVLAHSSDKQQSHPEQTGGLAGRALALVGILGSLLLLNQMERLVAAGALGMTELGVLGLGTTLIASPYRMLSAGVGYTLIPRLAACASKPARRRLLRQEFLVAMAFGVSGGALLLLLVPLLVPMIFGEQYEITIDLVIALILLGLVRLNSGVSAAAINALGDTAALSRFNLIGWISTAFAAAAAFSLSAFGSTGIVAGVTVAWLLRILSAAILVRKELY